MIKELEEAREKQFRDKDLRMAEQAKAERDEFLAIIARQKADEEAELKIEQEKREALYRHSNTLREQITKNDDVRRQNRLDYLEEGKKTR